MLGYLRGDRGHEQRSGVEQTSFGIRKLYSGECHGCWGHAWRKLLSMGREGVVKPCRMLVETLSRTQGIGPRRHVTVPALLCTQGVPLLSLLSRFNTSPVQRFSEVDVNRRHIILVAFRHDCSASGACSAETAITKTHTPLHPSLTPRPISSGPGHDRPSLGTPPTS